MVTPEQLAVRLTGRNLDEVATLAEVSKKSLQRFIKLDVEPKLMTACKVIAALDVLDARGRKTKKAGA